MIWRVPLYAKMFLNGFERPSSVVFSVRVAPAPSPAEVEGAVRRLCVAHPLLASRVDFAFGVPRRFRPGGAVPVEAAEGQDDGRFEVERLSEPLDPERGLFAVFVLPTSGGARIVAQVHHAIVDAHYGRRIVGDFFAALAGRSIEGAWPEMSRPSARSWLENARGARVPSVSLTTDFGPESGRREVEAWTAVVPSFDARSRQLTRSELLASELLAAMHAYNRARGDAPDRIELMVAMTKRRGLRRVAPHAGYAADTRLIGWDTRLDVDRDANVRRVMRGRRDGHQDLALAALYAARRLGLVDRGPRRIRELHFTLSDLTSATTAFHRLRLDGHRLEEPRILVSPVAMAHAGLVAYRVEAGTALTVIAHRGALDGAALLDRLTSRLVEAAITRSHA